MKAYSWICLALVAIAPVSLVIARAEEPVPQPRIHVVYMGGNDCPPCVAWRREELPKLLAMPEFKGVLFSHVIKTIQSSVPPSFFLPSEVKPLKDKLDAANSGDTGSPHTVIFVNDEVYDWRFGNRPAEQIRTTIAAIRSGNKPPFRRCLKLRRPGCEKWVE